MSGKVTPMILYEHPDEYLRRLREEEARREHRDQLVRALRGTIPPFDEGRQQQLMKALREAAPFSGR